MADHITYGRPLLAGYFRRNSLQVQLPLIYRPWASFIPFDRHVQNTARSLLQAQGEREPGIKRRRHIEKLIFNRARLSSLKLLVQYFDPVLDRQRGAAAYMHEATYVGGDDPVRMARFERRYLVFQQLLR